MGRASPKRESGANPELPRSGKWERQPLGTRRGHRRAARPRARRPASARARARPVQASWEGYDMRSTISGFPRIGDRRELKTATEGYWAGRVPAGELEATARDLRRRTWTFLRDAGLGQVPSNHFSLYDQVLDTCVLVGAVPERHRRGIDRGPRHEAPGPPPTVDLDTYFAMARGRDDATAMEMTKWFDTNYHYLVPELGPEVEFRLAANPKPLAELAEARELGIATRPVLLGPVTFLLLAKGAGPDAGSGAGFDRLSLLDPLLEVYAELLDELEAAGA